MIQKFRLLASIISGICLSLPTASAQKNFESGFIITKTSDTLIGFIDNRQWVSAPKIVEFRTSKNGPSTGYSPLDIRGFGVEASWYAAKIVVLDKSPHEIDKLPDDNKPQFDADTLFLPALVLGKANLYTTEDENGKRHFFIEKDTAPLTELIYRLYSARDAANNRVVGKNERYKAQLDYYLGDCPAAAAIAGSTRYEETPLVKIFQQYNDCFSQHPNFIRKKDVYTRQFSILAGVSTFSMDFHSDESALDKADFNTSVNFSAGIGLNLVIPRTQGKWAIYNTLITRRYKIEARFTETQTGPFITTNHTVTFSLNHLLLSNLARYQFKAGRLESFLYAGLTTGYGFGAGQNDHREIYFDNDFSIEDRRALDQIRTFELAATLGAGISYHRISLEGRWTRSDGISAYASLRSPTSVFYVWVGYRLK